MIFSIQMEVCWGLGVLCVLGSMLELCHLILKRVAYWGLMYSVDYQNLSHTMICSEYVVFEIFAQNGEDNVCDYFCLFD